MKNPGGAQCFGHMFCAGIASSFNRCTRWHLALRHALRFLQLQNMSHSEVPTYTSRKCNQKVCAGMNTHPPTLTSGINNGKTKAPCFVPWADSSEMHLLSFLRGSWVIACKQPIAGADSTTYLRIGFVFLPDLPSPHLSSFLSSLPGPQENSVYASLFSRLRCTGTCQFSKNSLWYL